MTYGYNFIVDIYKIAVDAKDTNYLSGFLADDVHFRIGNHDMIVGKKAVLDANRSFFSSITSMKHQIDNVWSQNHHIICNGIVDYKRLDGTDFSATFATVLKLEDNKITEYFVYADISEL